MRTRSEISPRRGRASTAVAVALAAGLLGGAAPQGVEATPLRTGVFDLDAYDRASKLPFKRTRGAGARFVRLPLNWRITAPQGVGELPPLFFDAANPAEPRYQWRLSDRRIRRARASGLEPIPVVVDAPRWAMGRCSDDRGVCDPDAAMLRDFAAALAKRYNGRFDPDGPGPRPTLPRVRYWQGMNEPNLHLFFNPQRDSNGTPVSPYLYRTLINQFTAGIKAGDPRALVLAAGLAPLGRYPGVAPLDFMRRLLCMEGRRRPRPSCRTRVRFDIWTTHPYTTGGPTHHASGADDVSLGDLPQMHRLLRAAERAGHIKSPSRRVPFWVTEFSWDTRPPDCGGLRQKLAARWLSHAFYEMWRAGVSHVFWFLLRDQPAAGQGDEEALQSGLYLRARSLRADRPKLTLSAFRFPFVALRHRARVTLWGRTPSSRGGRIRIEMRTRGRWRRLDTLMANRFGIFKGKAAIPRSVRRTDPRWKVEPVRARFRGSRSVPFSMRFVPDRYVRPFGGCSGASASSVSASRLG